jgi:lactate dehydrogenase-like 2-hydroxyacid dehydrogenase
MKPKVFVAQPIPEVALDVLREEFEVTVYPFMDRQITVDELAAGARRSDWLYVLHETNVTAEVINANPNLKGIGCMASSNPLIDMDAANARRIPVIIEDQRIAAPNWPPATADLTMSMLLALAYRLVEAHDYTRSGKFRQEQTMAMLGIGCPGKTVGLIGISKMAEYMIPRIRAFEMRPIYTLARLSAEQERAFGLEWVADLDDLIKQSDFVCVTCDHSPSTHMLIGKRQLDLMKPQAYLINTRSGQIVDEPALICALQEKRIAGAALDVYWNQPPVTQDPCVPEELCALDNVILSPHNGGGTWETRSRKALSVAHAMVAMVRGERPPSLRNPEIYASV